MRIGVIHRYGLLAIISAIGFVSLSDAAPPDPAVLAAKQAFLKEMKKKIPSARVAAVTKFAETKHADVVDLLLKKGLADEDSEVREATRTALATMIDNVQVHHFLLDELKKAFKKPQANEQTTEIFRALASTTDAAQQAELIKLLDDYLASPRGNLLVPILVIDELGEQGDADAVRIVKFLSQAKVFENRFGYRRCIVQAMCQIHQPEAIDFLIDLLPKTQGLIQYDVIQHLTRMTKQKFRDNDRDWSNWWKDNRKDFKFPAADAAVADDAVDEQQPSYYRIPICAKRIVFVLDTSGSMRGAPIDAAKQALVKVVQSLPEAVSFDVIMFDNEANTWRPRLVPATREAKQEVTQVIAERGLRLGTASHAALTAAFELDPEVIYFLSDGEPTDGGPAQIVASITQLNRTRRISIHSIGVVTQLNGGIGLTLFMEPLSNKNYGTFRLVE